MTRRRLHTICLSLGILGMVGAVAVAQTTSDPPALFPPALRVKGCTESVDGAKAPVDSTKIVALFNACAIGGAAVLPDCTCKCWNGTKVTLAALTHPPGTTSGPAAPEGTVASCPPLGIREMQDAFDAYLAIEPQFTTSLKQAENLLVDRSANTSAPASTSH